MFGSSFNVPCLELHNSGVRLAKVHCCLNKAWQQDWEGVDDQTLAFLSEKYGEQYVEELLLEHGLEPDD